MAKPRQILKHGKSVASIRMVTKAMQTVASVRFRQAHERIATFAPFAERMARVIGSLGGRAAAGLSGHPLASAPAGVRRGAVLVITSNRGFCGSYNSALLHLAMQHMEQLRSQGWSIELHLTGKRGARRFEARGVAIDYMHDLPDSVEYAMAAPLANRLMEELAARDIAAFDVVHTPFGGSAQAKPVATRLLPITKVLDAEGGAAGKDDGKGEAVADFYPAPDLIIRRLLPAMVRLRLYQCFLDAAAAEQRMRMVAMRSATDNAEDMMRELKVAYNRARQAQITTELTEIIGGRVGIE